MRDQPTPERETVRSFGEGDAVAYETEREMRFCPACGHHHQTKEYGYICIGCPCEKQPPFRKLAL